MNETTADRRNCKDRRAKNSQHILHMFNPTKNVSPFDINMAYEANYDAVVPYSDVALEDIPALTQDTIFSRGPKGVKRTGIFIGGRDLGLSLDMLDAARGAMVPPFEVSVFLDPSGAITTAAALMACVERWSVTRGGGDLKGKRVYIFGGTGPVAICAGMLASREGAEAVLVSHQRKAIADDLAERYNKRFGTRMHGAEGSSPEGIVALLQEADIVLSAARAGVQVLSASMLRSAPRMIVAADVNAVPPLGIEGIGVHDMGKVLADTPKQAVGIGALAVGDVKYKVHTRLFQLMIDAERPLYLSFPEAFAVARELAAQP
ncbi:MAG: methylenetetrahydromethanopterin dehydrogenase [Gammaproteobacteria bacterium]|nr:methylenetetrahydromethanopterin dehydrogenase [Gammaproteobacteria bacterium]MCG3145649.1 NAD(P)-dependent methylenetetrahydromethanopterin dehydrogenase [Gammaproteobacteria bacterium]